MKINLCLLFIFYLFIYLYFRYTISHTYVSKSTIQGEGLFTSIPIYKGDIILDNIFPNKDPNEILYNNISKQTFSNYISYEGTKINHCSTNDNSYVFTNDYKIYKLIAKKTIGPNQELTVNYNITHSKFPFIAPSNSNYSTC
jgi:hypothetical protein